MYRRAADYVDRLAKGAKPADLPIELVLGPPVFNRNVSALFIPCLAETLPKCPHSVSS